MNLENHLSDSEMDNFDGQCINEMFVSTGESARPIECYWTWFYQISIADQFEDNFLEIKRDKGIAELCACRECRDFGLELYEYYSVYQALKWIKARYPQVLIHLFVDSERFFSDYSAYLQSYHEGLYQCSFLKTLGRDLTRLLSTLDVKVYDDSEEVCSCEA